MELKSLLLPEKVVTFDFPGCPGLQFDLVFLSKESSQKIMKKCTVTKFNKQTRQPYEELDSDLFLEVYVRAIVKDWRGFKLKYLNDFVLAEFELDDEEQELEYSEENALELMKNSTVFDNWVSEVVSNLENFTKSK